MAQFQSTNLTDCIRYIHRNLGIKLITPELSAKEIAKIVTGESLKTFSKFFPYVVRTSLKEEHRIPGKLGFYKIPNLEFLEVVRMKTFFANNSYAFTNGVATIPMSLNPIGQQLYSDYLSAVTTPITFNFWVPDIIESFPKQGIFNDVIIETETMHPDHLRTIGLKMRDHFYRLALLDVLVTLQPLRSRFQNLSSEYGNISLFMDRMDSAIAERDELIKRFETESMFSGNKKRVFWA